MSSNTSLGGASPHAHDRSGVNNIMFNVCLALAPVTAWGIFLWGLPALMMWVLCLVSAMAAEAFCLYLRQQPLSRLTDGSAMLTGWMLAMTLPPWCPWWVAVGGSAFAIIIGKQIYGGIGQNLFNPALLARIALLISFPVPLTTWIDPGVSPSFADAISIVFGQGPLSLANADAFTGATWLGDSKAAVKGGADMLEWLGANYSLHNGFVGQMRGSMGETSALLVLLGAAWLMFRRIISWHIPVALLGTLALLALVSSHTQPERFAGPMFHLLSGGAMIGAFFYATDYVTSPTTKQGQILFGIGAGAMIFAIRSWGGFPEAVAFGILFMNALTPLIDRVTKPRVYGRNRRGEAVAHVSAQRRVN
ncbi:RnfABCDGE type electron transport complex subunit D [Oceanobacter mangrovi]|uniref:RnfABCDGE type electron transport complex subunit D n=1 Tax=Oceanobacter mangrovi TaxID=2862510 RepID=UPI001C8DD4F2|nr:RnfABCDGE type electron transport complex subunit D [Oceanobacter mangrovi]